MGRRRRGAAIGALSRPVLAMNLLPPAVTRLYVNIGSNDSPQLAPADNISATIAFEPVVGCRIKRAHNLFVVHAAVSDEASLASMNVLNSHGLSSSLAEPRQPPQEFVDSSLWGCDGVSISRR